MEKEVAVFAEAGFDVSGIWLKTEKRLN